MAGRPRLHESTFCTLVLMVMRSAEAWRHAHGIYIICAHVYQLYMWECPCPWGHWHCSSRPTQHTLPTHTTATQPLALRRLRCAPRSRRLANCIPIPAVRVDPRATREPDPSVSLHHASATLVIGVGMTRKAFQIASHLFHCQGTCSGYLAGHELSPNHGVNALAADSMYACVPRSKQLLP
jgi:hypothetical protein